MKDRVVWRSFPALGAEGTKPSTRSNMADIMPKLSMAALLSPILRRVLTELSLLIKASFSASALKWMSKVYRTLFLLEDIVSVQRLSEGENQELFLA